MMLLRTYCWGLSVPSYATLAVELMLVWCIMFFFWHALRGRKSDAAEIHLEHVSLSPKGRR